MSKVLRFAIPAALSAAVVTLSGSSGKAQLRQYGFPITEEPSRDLTCYMVTRSGNTLNLAPLCGGRRQTVVSPSPRQSVTEAQRPVSIPRRRLDSSQYLRRYEELAETYPDSNVVSMLASMPKIEYAESVCDRLSTGLTLEQIRTEDIQKLELSGSLTRDNARKQNIEITLKLAPQYYCPEGTP